jgi:ElaA protein
MFKANVDMLKIYVKTFNQLTTKELYDILQLRSEVFVVEQDCVYQDIDGKDQKALHVLGFKADKLIAYTRLFKPGDYFKEASIGRVVVAKNQRQFKYGYDIMKASIEAIKTHYNETVIKISAQVYLKSFYNNLGFKEVGEEYLEDDIPHIAMFKE